MIFRTNQTEHDIYFAASVMLSGRGVIPSGGSDLTACLVWSLRFDMHPLCRVSSTSKPFLIKAFEEKQNAELTRASICQ
jgi:hypothetical protein